jgi:hypothetical protein
MVSALERGLEPHPTTGDHLPHDVLVSNTAGTIFKVQVKGTGTARTSRADGAHRNYPRYRITAGSGGKKTALDCSKVDILACYVEPKDMWYIIPCLKLRGKGVWFYPDNPNSKAYYEQFKEAWDFFLT